MDDKEYIAEQSERIIRARDEFPLQPILFVGSGLSRRWIGAPTWYELLDWAIENCPVIEYPIQFYDQQEPDLQSVAGRISTDYQKWAWEDGRDKFPSILFESKVPPEIYLKYHISQYIKRFGTDVSATYQLEKEAFHAIRPHAIITTNYDSLLEAVLPGYQPVLGTGLLSAPFANIGEIYKIHGTVEKPSSLVLTKKDYDKFSEKRKYLSAKLLTFFAEHPVVFVGYSVEDPNIQKILGDLNEAVGIKGGLKKNLFFLTRRGDSKPAIERVLQVSPDQGIRVNSIEAEDFTWVFRAFGHNAPLANVNPQVLRSILARTFQLVRSDIPKQQMEVDFELINGNIGSQEELAKVFGIGTLQPVTGFSARYKYNLTEVGKNLGFPGWHGANRLFSEIHTETGVDLKSFDNRYHGTVRISVKSKAQMYSDDAIVLLTKVRDGQPYDLDLGDDAP